MPVTQIPNPEEVETPLGEGFALYIWEWPSQLWWGVVQVETGEVWWWPNHLIRFCPNISEGRCATTPIKPNARVQAALKPHRKRYSRRK